MDNMLKNTVECTCEDFVAALLNPYLLTLDLRTADGSAYRL